MKSDRNAKTIHSSTTGRFVTHVNSSGGRHMSTSDALEKHLSINSASDPTPPKGASRSIGAAKVTVGTRKTG
jgi:hypothetical protein